MKSLTIKFILMLVLIGFQSNKGFANEINIDANSKTVIKSYKEDMTTVNHIIISSFKETLFKRSMLDIITPVTNIVKKVNDGRIFETFDGGINWYEINEQKIEDLSFRVFPNPASEYITIQASEVLESTEGSEIKIFSMLGECVLTVRARQAVPLQRIDVSHLPNGAYYITILTNDKKVINYRFVKK